MTAINWPDRSSEWWWMRYRVAPRAAWRVLLVTRDDHEGCEFVRSHQDCNCFTRSITADWQATFVPAQTPPEPADFLVTTDAERPVLETA